MEITYNRKCAEAFAKDLFDDLIFLHSAFFDLRTFSRAEDRRNKGESCYDFVVGKGVMSIWYSVQKYLFPKLRKEFPGFCKTEDEFFKYLKLSTDIVLSNTFDVHDQILTISAILLEILSFLYRRGVTRFMLSAPCYWMFMFDQIELEEFQKQGSWFGLKLVAKKMAEEYDKCETNIVRSCYSTSFSNFYLRVTASFPSMDDQSISGSEFLVKSQARETRMSSECIEDISNDQKGNTKETNTRTEIDNFEKDKKLQVGRRKSLNRGKNLKTPKKNENTSTPYQKGTTSKLPISTSNKSKTPESKSVTPKLGISDSAKSKASATLAQSKALTGPSKIQSKSPDKYEKARRLSSTKVTLEPSKPKERTLSEKSNSSTKDIPSEVEKTRRKSFQLPKMQISKQTSSKDSASSAAKGNLTDPLRTKDDPVSNPKSESTTPSEPAAKASKSKGVRSRSRNPPLGSKASKDPKIEKPRWR